MIREPILFRPFFSLLLLLSFSPFCTYEPTSQIHPNKTTYEIGETFDSTGMVVTATYSYGAPKQLSSNEYQLTLTDSNDASFNLSTPFTTMGTYTLTVEYNKIKSAPITITVEHKGYIYDENSKTYYVSNENGLMAWNEAVQSDLLLNCTLTEDINMTGQEWTPVGNSGQTYNGTFDGQGHTITSLNISSPSEAVAFHDFFCREDDVYPTTIIRPAILD